MIIPLSFDSALFGYPVGKLIVKENELNDINEADLDSYNLVYVFSDRPVEKRSFNLKLADEKITLIKPLKLLKIYENSGVDEYNGKETRQLIDLALQSGIYSRFFRDKNFVQDEFKKLYTLWLQKSVSKEICNKIFIHKKGDKINGFITVAVNNQSGKIGLIAVNSGERGRGIGSSLLIQVENYVFSEGKKNMEVVTQGKNLPAIRLYVKNGYEVLSKTYIYHRWKGK